ncbi:MAG: hypothetical protein J1F12_04285 [Muribaculaceae bacterium]|nr:hypothetical protein [Muribaculaceae bacterium]
MKNLIFLLLLYWWPVFLLWGNYAPKHLVSHFSDKIYNARFQNWDISQNSKGIIFIGNSEGLLQFDSYHWTLHPLPTATIARAVFCDNEFVYVGSFEEFGYFNMSNKDGNLIYNSISSKMPKEISLENEEIWKILPWKNKILFQSFSHIFCYDPINETVERLNDKITGPNKESQFLRPLFCYVSGENIYAQRINGGLYVYTPMGWKNLWPDSVLSHVMGISFPLDKVDSEVMPEGTLLFTQNSLIYKIQNGKPQRLYTELDKELQDTHINRVLQDDNHTIYIGTISQGIYHITTDGRLIEKFSVENGLFNNTVLGLLKDQDNNIWAALDYGIALIHCGTPVSMFHFSSPYGDNTNGTGYGIGMHGDKFIMATNQGAYFLDNDKLFLINNSKGQNWFVKSFDNQTFIGGNDQTIVLSGINEEIVYDFSGTDIKKGLIHNREVLVQSTYYGLEIYTKNSEGIWTPYVSVEGIEAPLRQIEIEPDGSIWGAHWSKGVFKIYLSNDLKKVISKDFYPSLIPEGIPRKIYVMKLRGETLFSQDQGFYYYDKNEKKFLPAKNLGVLNNFNEIRDITPVNDNRYWFSGSESYNLVDFTGGNYKVSYSIPISIFPRRNNGDNSTLFIKNDTTFFIMNDIIGMIPLDEIENKTVVPPLSINSIGYYNSQGQLVKLPLEPEKTPSIPNDNLIVRISYPDYNKSVVKYLFSITSRGRTKDSVSNIPYIAYPELSWGKHLFKCTVLGPDNNPLASLDYEVNVAVPHALRWWAICCYAVAFIFILVFVTRIISKRKLRIQHQLFEKAEAEKNLKIQQQSLLIAHQEKLLLESKLSEKNKELASMALSEYRHRQTLDNLNATLNDLKRKGKEATGAEKVLKEFSRNEGDTNAFWNMFEKNFDLIHEHFFHNLRKQFPTLTPADMKFCALLRMNMSTKEISRFTNLSVRGVETARYRLRKKFNLSSEQSLGQFLIDFNSEE